MSGATRGDLNRSRRHRELRAPNGFGDELRTTLVSAGVAWGGLTLLRADDRGAFTTAEVDLMGSLSQCLAEGLRRSTLLAALRGARHPDEGVAGLVLLADDDSVVMADAAGRAWLAQIGFDVVAAVAGRARTPVGDDARLARARVRTAAGGWLVVRGSALSGEGDARTAITIEPAGAHDLAPLIVDAYGLTDRERAITQARRPGAADQDDRRPPAHLTMDGAGPSEVRVREGRRPYARRVGVARVSRAFRASLGRA